MIGDVSERGGDEMDKIQRLRADIDVLDKKLHKTIFAYNTFVAEQQEYNRKIAANMEVIYNTFVKPEIEKQEKAKKVIITPFDN